MKFQVGLIGCGLIGKKRLINIGKYGRIVSLCDKDFYKAKKLATNVKEKIELYNNWKNLIELIPSFYSKNKMKKTGIAGIFAASLELTKEGVVKITQKELFDKLMIKKS